MQFGVHGPFRYRCCVVVVVPGAGQIYNGKFLRGVIWLVVTPGLWIGSGGFLGWVCHLVSSYMAYQWARDNPPWER